MSETRKTVEGSIYFVSFATVGWVDVFIRPSYANLLIDSLNFCIANKGLQVYHYVIMPSHVHLIAGARQGRLSSLLRDFKSYTSKQITQAIQEHPQESRREWMLAMFEEAGSKNGRNSKYQFWQQSNHPIELWSNRVIDQKINYVHNNPVKAGLVTAPEHYVLSSAHPDQTVLLEEME